MKSTLPIIFFLVSTCIYCQKESEFIGIKFADLNRITKINDLIQGFPAECDITKYELIIRANGRVYSIEDPARVPVAGFLKRNAEIGAKIWLDIQTFSCAKALKKNYKFIVTE